MRAVILGLAAIAATFLTSLAVLDAADSGAVTFAVIRGDGVLIPIVTRNGTKWAHTWPVPVKSADIPLTLDGIPKRWWGKTGPTTTWHAWTPDGVTRDVTVDRPTWYLAHCQQGVGLKTKLTIPPPLPPPDVQPYPKLGLASSAPVAFRTIEPIDESLPLWDAIRARIATAIGKAENEMDGKPRVNVGIMPKHPFPEAERAKVETRLEALYRLPLEGSRFLYYYEAAKRYGMPTLEADGKAPAPTPDEDGCSRMIFAQGWLVIGADGNVPVAEPEDVRFSSCHYDDVQVMLPLGSVLDGSKPIWIGQLTGHENESFLVLRWDETAKKPKPVFHTHGGWCGADDGGW
jgi:hypothetical protein